MRNDITVKVVADISAAKLAFSEFATQASRLTGLFRKSNRFTNACVHALNAERRARRLRRRGENHAAKVWEHHADVCRRVGSRIDFGGGACTP